MIGAKKLPVLKDFIRVSYRCLTNGVDAKP